MGSRVVQHRLGEALGGVVVRAGKWSPLVVPACRLKVSCLSCIFVFAQPMGSGSDRCEVGHCSQQAETKNTASSAKIGLVPVVTRNLIRGGLKIRAKYTMCGHLVVHTNQQTPHYSAPSKYLGGDDRRS